MVIRAGRELTRRVLEAIRHCQADPPEKKAPRRTSPCGVRLLKDKASQKTVAAAGRVELTCRSSRCPDRGQTFYPADALLGTLNGEGTADPPDWLGCGRDRLLADGWPGLMNHIGQTPSEGRTLSGQATLEEMISSFAEQTDCLKYFGRP